MKKYRVLSMVGIMALTAGSLSAQDYDDIYYDASKSKTVEIKTSTPAKTTVIYGDVPEKYKVVAEDNYRIERDEDEYNRRGAYDPSNINYEVDINGDTIYEDAFANTRRIERFYNPDIVILSDDNDLIELYYDESPSVNLIIGSDSFSYYGWDSPFYSSYYPWYTGWYSPWYTPWYYHRTWYPLYNWGYGYYTWYSPFYGWGGPYYGYHYGHYWYPGHSWVDSYHYANYNHNYGIGGRSQSLSGSRIGLASNRNGRDRVSYGAGTNRNNIASKDGNRPSNVGNGRPGVATSRNSGNIGNRKSVATSRSSQSTSRPSATSSRSYSEGTSRSYGGSRTSGSTYRSSSSGGYSGGSSSRSSGGYSGGSSSRSSGGYSGGSSSRSSGGYSGGSSSRSSGGGSRGGSSGGGGHRR